ncbi:MAG: hypothetical protein NVSMB23_21510 [Myxococcales bacterium]
MRPAAGSVAVLPLLGAFALTAAALAASGGHPGATAAPVLGLALLFAALRAPLRVCVAGLLFLALVADSPQDNPMDGFWRSPFFALGQVLCSNWSSTFGVAALPFSGMDLLCLLLLARTVREAQGPAPLASALRAALAAFLGALLLLGAAGLARGGSFGSAYWQVRQIAFIPVFAWLLAHALTGVQDHLLLGRLVVAAALTKASVGLYFAFAVAGAQGISPSYITTHADTLLFCLSITLVCLRWLEEPSTAHLLRCVWVVPVLLAAVWLNNRRIAWVGLSAVVASAWQLSRWNAAKRAVARLGLSAIPLVAAYLVAGWSSPGAAFKPVAALRTLVATRDGGRAADASTHSREIENFNLLQTVQRHPLGTGLGHGYDEVVKGPSIASDFALYRYIPHNSVLWMLSVGGPIGFFLLWSPFVVGIYLAARAHRLARRPLDRVAALASVAAQLLFLVQAYGDMGTQSWSTAWLVAAALAVAGKLALSTGAWPLDVSLPDPSPDLAPALEPAWTPHS